MSFNDRSLAPKFLACLDMRLLGRQLLIFYVLQCLIFSLHPAPSIARDDAASQEETLELLERCTHEDVSEDDAQNVGRFLGRHFNVLEFDAAAFSRSCEEKISAGLFEKYDEIASINLIRFFWDDEFLIRHLKVSQLRRLECDLSCLLRLDKRPIKTFAVFREVVKSIDGAQMPALDFLLARTLISNQASKDEIYRELAEHIVDGDRRKNVVQLLYILGAPEFLRNVFSSDGGRICLRDFCLRHDEAKPLQDCEEIARQGSPQGVIGLKLWAITTGGNNLNFGSIIPYAGWIPVRVKKTRHNKKQERRF